MSEIIWRLKTAKGREQLALPGWTVGCVKAEEEDGEPDGCGRTLEPPHQSCDYDGTAVERWRVSVVVMPTASTAGCH